MKMKSLKAQFIGAIAMVLVAAIAMGSSTYAWFAMNNQVTADGMQVQVKSNSTFLLIKETGSVTGANDAAKADDVQATAAIHATLTVANDDADLYPAKPWAAGDATKYTRAALSNPEAVTTYANASVPGNWFTANSSDPATSAVTVANDAVLSVFTDYVIKKSVTMTLSDGSENADQLTVTGNIVPKGASLTSDPVAVAGKTYYTVTDGKYTKFETVAGTTDVTGKYESSVDITAVKVLVVTDDNNITTLDYTKNGIAQSLHEVDDETFTYDTVVVADIYIYYDGSEAAVTSNNKTNLGAANIDLAFNVTCPAT